MFHKKTQQNRGITLIALVVTIIVLIILAGVSISTLTGSNGIITKATEAKTMTELSTYQEELALYKQQKYMENASFQEETLTAGKTELNYNTKNEEGGNIKTIITTISDEYLEKLEIIKGELLINTQNKKEIELAQSLGIAVNPYEITDEGKLTSSNGNLLLMDEKTGTLTIPDSVKIIGEGAFTNLEGLKTIIIPSSVETIEQNAFKNNTTLETVIMQEKENTDGSISGVKYIGDGAFQGCSNLKKVQMANSVEEVGVQIFYMDSQLTDINISINLENISSYMFSVCTNLKNIEIPEGVISIDEQAFARCANLETIKMPKTLQKINPTAFNRCTKLTNMDLSGNLNFSFANGVLLGNNKTEMVIILESAINGNTFSIPNTVTTLASDQIAQYTNITKVVIPASVTTIDSSFFNINITEVSIDAGNATYETDGKAIYTKDIENKELVKYYGNETAVIIEKEIKSIGSYAFANKNLNSIDFPDTLETIGSLAFSGCTQLKEISLGVNIKSFDNMSIYNSGIEKITLKPDSEGNVNPNFSIRKAKCNGIETDALFNADGTQFISPIKMLGNINTYEIPEGVEQIAGYAFHNQNKMTSIILPNTLERIGRSFNFCTSLQSIEIPSSVQEIATDCFSEANNLTQIKINKPKGSIANAPWGCIYGDKALIWLSE